MQKRDNMLYLCNFDNKVVDTDQDLINKLWSGNWDVNNIPLCAELLLTRLDMNNVKIFIQSYRRCPEIQESILHMAISAFLTFCDLNWNAHAKEFSLEKYFDGHWPKDLDAAYKLQKDSEPIYENILYPELLLFCSRIFAVLYAMDQNLINLWWYFRFKVTHQRALENTSATLFSDIEILIDNLSNKAQTITNPRVKVLLYSEIAQAYLIYDRVQKAENYLLKARELAGLKLELTGALGKRTKYQQIALPQLTLASELDAAIERSSAQETHGDTEMPVDVELQDDVRLNRVQFDERVNQAELPSLEQTLCLLTAQYVEKSQPKDNLVVEEVQPYLDAVLTQPCGVWSTRVAALLARCKLEASQRRTVERAMQQCECIVNDTATVAPTARLSYLWASGLAPASFWRHQLADLYLSLGLTKSALEEYQKLKLYEDVVVCYTLMQLKHKAADVITEQMMITPSVKLLCLLGDVTDDVAYYEQAWNMSMGKSSAAQRHWGNFLFERRKYLECIPHYEKSLAINSLQEPVWLKLGFAALQTEKWDISARAYQRYTALQPNTFEAWNNLAKVYVQQGNKPRAHRALLEALKYNYDNWKLWQNFILVSMDTGHFEDVMRGVHRLLDLQRKYEDVEVLRLLVRAILQDQTCADGNKAGRLRRRALELFGHITAVHQNNPDIWQLYSDLSPTYLLKAQRLQKAYKGYTQGGNWPNNPESSKKVLEILHQLLDYSLKAHNDLEDKDRLQCNQQLCSTRLTGQAVIRALEKQNWPGLTDLLDEIKILHDQLTEIVNAEIY